MNNLKSITITNDGASKRVAIAYDVIDENGKVINPNKRLNRIVTDATALKNLAALEKFANALMED